MLYFILISSCCRAIAPVSGICWNRRRLLWYQTAQPGPHNAEDEAPGTTEGAHSAAYSTPCFKRRLLWAMDDPRTRPPRLHAQSRHAIPHAARFGTSRVLEVQDRTLWTDVSAPLPRNRARPRGEQGRQAPGPRVDRGIATITYLRINLIALVAYPSCTVGTVRALRSAACRTGRTSLP